MSGKHTAKGQRKRKPEVFFVANSCGCVFCDLDLKPSHEGGKYWHETKSGRVNCAKPRRSALRKASGEG